MRYWWCAAGVILVALSITCITWWNPRTERDQHIPYIVCTTSIVGDTVAHVAGDYAHVTTLMGSGVDPHVYRARESDVHRLASADMVFYNGLHLEGKMDDVFERMYVYAPAVAVTRDIPRDTLLASEFAELYDPHVWFDVTLWKYTIDTIEYTLSEYFPEYADVYQRNAQWYRDQLDMLDQYVRRMTRHLHDEQRRLITAHDAFGYFGRAYGFDVVGLQGISTDSQIGTYDVISLADYIVTHRVSTIFVEASIPRRNLEAVQEAVAARGHAVDIGDYLYSDTLGCPGRGADTYVDMVRYNVQAIVHALEQSG